MCMCGTPEAEAQAEIDLKALGAYIVARHIGSLIGGRSGAYTALRLIQKLDGYFDNNGDPGFIKTWSDADLQMRYWISMTWIIDPNRMSEPAKLERDIRENLKAEMVRRGLEVA